MTRLDPQTGEPYLHAVVCEDCAHPVPVLPAVPEEWRVVRWFGPKIAPSTDVAYRVETVELLSRREADALRDRMNEPPSESNVRAAMSPCPVCGDRGGFHLDEPHEAAVARIPARLMQRTARSKREEARASRRANHDAYRAALAQDDEATV